MAGDERADQGYRRELGDGLVLRWSTADDVDRLAALYGDVFRQSPEDPPNERIQIWTRDLMSGRHPLIAPSDFAVVESSATGELVTGTCLMSAVWDVEGVAIPVGRAEVVATRPAYRRRGLVRSVFELIHARSDVRGDLAQGITGIPYYYRQFGYEYALDLGFARVLPASSVPKLAPGAGEPYDLRDATADDVPQIAALYDRERAAAAVGVRIDARYWRWQVEGTNPEAVQRWRVRMVVDRAGATVGYVPGESFRWGPNAQIYGLAVEPGVPFWEVLPSVLRAVLRQAEAAPAAPAAPPLSGISLRLGRSHPVYDVLGDALPPFIGAPYAWYVRAPDVPRLVSALGPVLERRLAASAYAGYSGELLCDFYRGGLRLVFEGGRLAAAEDWRAPEWGRPPCRFPPLVFLQMLFGHRDLDALRRALPDVRATDEAAPLLRALFPARPSWVWPQD